MIVDKRCFQHGMIHGNFRDLSRRAASDNVLRDKAFNIAKNPKFDEYQRSVSSFFLNFFDRKSSGGTIIQN